MGVLPLCSWMLLSSHECCWCHRAMLMSAQGCFWGFMNAYKHSWVWPHVVMSTNEGPWPLLSTNEHLKATMSHQKHDAMAQTAFMSVDKHSWELHYGGHTTHSAFAPYLTVLMSAHGCSGLLMGALECSWALLSPPEWSCVFEFLIQ